MAIVILRAVVVFIALWAGGAAAVSLDASLLGGIMAGLAFGLAAVALEIIVGRAPASRVLGVAVGGAAGLLVAMLAWTAVSPALGAAVPARVLTALVGIYLGSAVGLRRARTTAEPGPAAAVVSSQAPPGAVDKIVDTSALIDGRLASMCETGFIEGRLVVPRFVVRELQRVADASDPLRRARGKRGFDVLQRLQALPGVTVEISEDDPAGSSEVDLKLVEVARARRAVVITTDDNLGRVAEVSGVRVLKVNDLAYALRPLALAGDTMRVTVVREGREPGQGVGFLDDGTMVVVEQGKRFIGQPADVTVTSTLQTSGGRMVFARPRGEDAEVADA
jgi:uncharacterized protein YacL